MADSSIHFVSDFLLGLAVAIVGYFLRELNSANKEKHAFALKEIELLKAQLLSSDEILAVVNGKYVSRRENDLMLKESDLAHAQLTHRIDKAEEETDKLRKHWHDAVVLMLQRLIYKLEQNK